MKKLYPERKKNWAIQFSSNVRWQERRFYFLFSSSDEGKKTLVGARRPNNILSGLTCGVFNDFKPPCEKENWLRAIKRKCKLCIDEHL